MNKHIVKTKNAIPASSETQDLAMQLLRGELDSYIEEIKEKKGIKDTEREEQYKKLFRILKKYFSENHNKERGIKAFTLNDSVFFTIALLNNFKFQYLTITDTAKVCNVLFSFNPFAPPQGGVLFLPCLYSRFSKQDLSITRPYHPALYGRNKRA